MSRLATIPSSAVSLQKPIVLHPLLAELLRLRGITEEKHFAEFLFPDFQYHIHDAFLLSDMEKAITRLKQALDNHQKIGIYADFDADGIPGAVIMHDFLKKIGYENFEIYIPHRHREGYGFHKDAITELHQRNVKLIITIDVGITYAQEVSYANDLHMDVIVTDHHEPSGELPQAFAIVNPKLGNYPDPMLCGASTAWKLVTAFLERYREEYQVPIGWEKWLLDMVGIATISDMVPLVRENRVLAHYGLLVLRKSKRLGLRALLKKVRIAQHEVTEDDVAFMITPRINAASRMAHPRDAFDLFVASADVVEEKVNHLVKLNDARKIIVAQTVKQAKKKIKNRDIGNVIVVGDPEWNLGILGLVATKLCEEYQRPVFVWSREGDVCKGSCRGTDAVSVVNLMESLPAETFIQFGGHANAGGFSIIQDNIHELEIRLSDAWDTLSVVLENQQLISPYDLSLDSDQINFQIYQAVARMAPFGIGNPKPIFRVENIFLQEVRQFGKHGEHIELVFKNSSGQVIKAIQFYAEPKNFSCFPETGKTVVLHAHLECSAFMGKKEVRLRIVDII